MRGSPAPQGPASANSSAGRAPRLPVDTRTAGPCGRTCTGARSRVPRRVPRPPRPLPAATRRRAGRRPGWGTIPARRPPRAWGPRRRAAVDSAGRGTWAPPTTTPRANTTGFPAGTSSWGRATRGEAAGEGGAGCDGSSATSDGGMDGGRRGDRGIQEPSRQPQSRRPRAWAARVRHPGGWRAQYTGTSGLPAVGGGQIISRDREPAGQRPLLPLEFGPAVANRWSVTRLPPRLRRRVAAVRRASCELARVVELWDAARRAGRGLQAAWLGQGYTARQGVTLAELRGLQDLAYHEAESVSQPSAA